LVVAGLDKHFSPHCIVEQITWIAFLQSLHRLYSFYVNPAVILSQTAEENLAPTSPVDPGQASSEARSPWGQNIMRAGGRLFSAPVQAANGSRETAKTKSFGMRKSPSDGTYNSRQEGVYLMKASVVPGAAFASRAGAPYKSEMTAGHRYSRAKNVSSSVVERNSAIESIDAFPSWKVGGPLTEERPWDGNATGIEAAIQRAMENSRSLLSDGELTSSELSRSAFRGRHEDTQLDCISEDDDSTCHFIADNSEQGHDSLRGHSHGSIEGLAKARKAARFGSQPDRAVGNVG
jgi:hypothetical protein